jgi:hypothetical protein
LPSRSAKTPAPQPTLSLSWFDLLDPFAGSLTQRAAGGPRKYEGRTGRPAAFRRCGQADLPRCAAAARPCRSAVAAEPGRGAANARALRRQRPRQHPALPRACGGHRNREHRSSQAPTAIGGAPGPQRSATTSAVSLVRVPRSPTRLSEGNEARCSSGRSTRCVAA